MVCGVRGEILSLATGVGCRIVVLRSGEDGKEKRKEEEKGDRDGVRERCLVVTNLEMGLFPPIYLSIYLPPSICGTSRWVSN